MGQRTNSRCGADHPSLIDFLVNMSASADILAQAKVEIDLKAIPEGKNVRIPLSPPISYEKTLCAKKL